ncbi:signal recognition particle 9 kDa protein-domain-containing protein [Aspergillus bertholletiae]|uniref:Signal recognition particle 9 kDa protein-domain-containing protein n=1 Tax=Aspergillus bertholletiae TaxID=1226010 RepID=A0A5N7AZ28_9EURO|nr:signal recognition particle 9 kDa protein-domain-containing protein [Aspergillus bertholletiae]
MPYLPTSQAYLEQSALLLEAYPNDTRITTKYNFPSSQKPKPAEESTTPTAPIASLTLKTYNPTSGICLKYRTNKAAEVGRLITSLGKLAGGASVAALGLGNAAAAPGAQAGGDVEMTDAPEEGTGSAAPTAKMEGNKGGKGKKKGGKGKR